jgi:hypothetical protein
MPHDPQVVRLRGGLVAGRRLGLRLGSRERHRLRSSLNHVRRLAGARREHLAQRIESRVQLFTYRGIDPGQRGEDMAQGPDSLAFRFAVVLALALIVLATTMWAPPRMLRTIRLCRSPLTRFTGLNI